MRVRVALLMLGAGLLGVGLFYATAASGKTRIPACSAVDVYGGRGSTLTGGQGLAAVGVRNVGRGPCAISGHPWVRLGPLRYSVTVGDATPALFGSNAGLPGQVVTLQPHQRAFAAILLVPGTCSNPRQWFDLRLRAGWGRRGASILHGFCKDGSGSIWLGSFQRPS